MGLADEVMELVKQYGRWCWRAGAFDDIQSRCDASGRGDLLGVSIYSRLTELEHELEGYRSTWVAVRNPSSLPCSSEYVNSQTGYNGESGG